MSRQTRRKASRQRAETWTPAEAADRWGVSERHVRNLCAAGAVPGATDVGLKSRAKWLIPKGARRPGSVAVQSDAGEYAAGGVG